MTTIENSQDWKMVNKDIKPDSRRRVVLPSSVVSEGVTFHAYYNSSGQILLDPQVTVPLSEVWLFKNPDALALVRQGLSDIVEGKVSKVDIDNL